MHDIIGDTHGQAAKLHALLRRLGYRVISGAYRHPTRTVIFVGDFIDRGPKQLETIRIVRAMIEAGTARAVMGNHELNAIAWHTPDATSPGTYLRTRAGDKGAKNRHQHAAFLAEVEHDPALHQEIISWFMTLPLWLDLPGLRVVHACWHESSMAVLRPHLTADSQLTPELLASAHRAGSPEFLAIEAVLKGLEITLPPGHEYTDVDGVTRANVRTRWWNDEAITYRSLALLPAAMVAALPDIRVEQDKTAPYDNAKPVFFGHYWMTGEHKVQSGTKACVDYSAAKNGPLVAYRWDGESTLNSAKFVGVD